MSKTISSATKVICGGNPAVLLPAGSYYVGDPCYASAHENHDRWMRQLESVWGEPWPASHSVNHFGGEYGVIAKDSQGPKWWAAHGTAYGDGQYEGSDGYSYCVDAGLLGVVPVRYAEKNALDAMRIVQFDDPFSITYEEHEGIVVIGHIEIKTDPEDELDTCDDCGYEYCECEEETNDEEES